MPVQKYMAANNIERYKSDGSGARHTLFSGTTVLQAGGSNQDDVLAIVTSTGLSPTRNALKEFNKMYISLIESVALYNSLDRYGYFKRKTTG